MCFDHRGRFFETARGSAMKSAATLDEPVAVGVFPLDEMMSGKSLRFAVVKMLSKMTGHTPAA